MASSTRKDGICIELHAGDALQIEFPARRLDSETVKITLEQKSGQRARLRIDADDAVTIGRRCGTRRHAPA